MDKTVLIVQRDGTFQLMELTQVQVIHNQMDHIANQVMGYLVIRIMELIVII